MFDVVVDFKYAKDLARSHLVKFPGSKFSVSSIRSYKQHVTRCFDF